MEEYFLEFIPEEEDEFWPNGIKADEVDEIIKSAILFLQYKRKIGNVKK